MIAPADCPHNDTWFDRTLCECQDGGAMHTICADCSAILDGGRHEMWLGEQEDERSRTYLSLDEAGVERLAAALVHIALHLPDTIIFSELEWDKDFNERYARAIIERLREGGES